MVNTDIIKNHVYRKVGELVQKRIDHLGIGHKMQDLPEELQHESFKFYVNDPTRKGGPNMRIIRLNPERPSLTVTGFIFNKFVHPTENRYVTVREAARLQGFPDELEFVGSLTSTQRQVGNAVPVQLGKAVLGSVAATLRRNKAVQNNVLTAMSLFSGAGGLDIGAEGVHENGVTIETKLVTDLWHDACRTLKKYFGTRVAVVEQDLSQVADPVQFFREHTGSDQLPEIIYGGPPCQSFSQAGKQKGITDLRGSLVYDFLRCVETIKPKAFVMENVANMRGIEGGSVLATLVRSFKELGYNTDYKVLTASDYGSPQVRKRIFIVGIRSDIGKPSFPTPTHSAMPSLLEASCTTVGDAFAGLPEAVANGTH